MTIKRITKKRMKRRTKKIGGMGALLDKVKMPDVMKQVQGKIAEVKGQGNVSSLMSAASPLTTTISGAQQNMKALVGPQESVKTNAGPMTALAGPMTALTGPTTALAGPMKALAGPMKGMANPMAAAQGKVDEMKNKEMRGVNFESV